MGRPWYVFLLIALAGLVMFLTAFRTMFAATSDTPGGFVIGPYQRLVVRPGGPLSTAGIELNDRFIGAESLVVADLKREGWPWLVWKSGRPQSGWVEVERGGKRLHRFVEPRPPGRAAQVFWFLTGILNLGLSGLAVALLWQRPRDPQALHLSALMVSSSSFLFPREAHFFAEAIAAHFFSLYPAAPDSLREVYSARRIRTHYAAVLVAFVLASVLWEQGEIPLAELVACGVGIGYALFGIWRVAVRLRAGEFADPRVGRLLLAAAVTVLGAGLLAVDERSWYLAGQFFPVNTAPGALLSALLVHLVFRVRAFDVRIVARRTLHSALARWTLGALCVAPALVILWSVAQTNALEGELRMGYVLPHFLWALLAGLLLGFRGTVMARLEEKFFPEELQRRRGLLRLADEISRFMPEAEITERLVRRLRSLLGDMHVQFSPTAAVEQGREEVRFGIRRADDEFGTLVVTPGPSGRSLSSEEGELVGAVAVQAAFALENARLHQRLLDQQSAELTARTAGVVAGIEDERRRLAADLHDQVLPGLRQIAVRVDRHEHAGGANTEELQELEREVRESMDTVREVMEALRPSALDVLGLVAALDSAFRTACRDAEPPLRVTVRAPPDEPALPEEVSLGIYRVAQEAIHNLTRHAHATQAGLECRTLESGFEVRIWDNGLGMPDESRSLGRGTRNMRHRAEVIGARVTWSAREGGGTEVHILWSPELPDQSDRDALPESLSNRRAAVRWSDRL